MYAGLDSGGGGSIGVHCGPHARGSASLSVLPASRAFDPWGTGGTLVHERGAHRGLLRDHPPESSLGYMAYQGYWCQRVGDWQSSPFSSWDFFSRWIYSRKAEWWFRRPTGQLDSTVTWDTRSNRTMRIDRRPPARPIGSLSRPGYRTAIFFTHPRYGGWEFFQKFAQKSNIF